MADLHAHRARRHGHRQRARAVRRDGQAGAVLDLHALDARAALPRAARGGRPPKAKLCFFFDEAHLLFDDASKALLDEIEQTARLIRSKGVGVFFVTQTPTDVPASVLAQLGNRFEHALRASRREDADNLRKTARTFPIDDVLRRRGDTDLPRHRRGLRDRALARGAFRRPLAATRLLPPDSLMAALDPAAFQADGRGEPTAGEIRHNGGSRKRARDHHRAHRGSADGGGPGGGGGRRHGD